MKTIIKLLVAALILNATARLGLSAWQQYQFRDSVQEMLLFGNSQTTAQLQEQIVEEAEEKGCLSPPAMWSSSDRDADDGGQRNYTSSALSLMI